MTQRGRSIRRLRTEVYSNSQACHKWLPFVPCSRLLISVSQLQDLGFAPVRADDLQADWESGLSEAARNGDRGQSPDIHRTRVAQQHNFLAAQALVVGFEVGEAGRGDRNGGSNQDI